MYVYIYIYIYTCITLSPLYRCRGNLKLWVVHAEEAWSCWTSQADIVHDTYMYLCVCVYIYIYTHYYYYT